MIGPFLLVGSGIETKSFGLVVLGLPLMVPATFPGLRDATDEVRGWDRESDPRRKGEGDETGGAE